MLNPMICDLEDLRYILTRRFQSSFSSPSTGTLADQAGTGGKNLTETELNKDNAATLD